MYIDLLKLGLLILIVYYILHDAYVYVIGFILLSLLIQLFSKNPLWYLLLPIIFIHLCFYYFHASVEGFHRPRTRRRRRRQRNKKRRNNSARKGNKNAVLEMMRKCHDMANSYRQALKNCNDGQETLKEALNNALNNATEGTNVSST